MHEPVLIHPLLTYKLIAFQSAFSFVDKHKYERQGHLDTPPTLLYQYTRGLVTDVQNGYHYSIINKKANVHFGKYLLSNLYIISNF